MTAAIMRYLHILDKTRLHRYCTRLCIFSPSFRVFYRSDLLQIVPGKDEENQQAAIHNVSIKMAGYHFVRYRSLSARFASQGSPTKLQEQRPVPAGGAQEEARGAAGRDPQAEARGEHRKEEEPDYGEQRCWRRGWWCWRGGRQRRGRGDCDAARQPGEPGTTTYIRYADADDGVDVQSNPRSLRSLVCSSSMNCPRWSPGSFPTA